MVHHQQAKPWCDMLKEAHSTPKQEMTLLLTVAPSPGSFQACSSHGEYCAAAGCCLNSRRKLTAQSSSSKAKQLPQKPRGSNRKGVSKSNEHPGSISLSGTQGLRPGPFRAVEELPKNDGSSFKQPRTLRDHAARSGDHSECFPLGWLSGLEQAWPQGTQAASVIVLNSPTSISSSSPVDTGGSTHLLAIYGLAIQVEHCTTDVEGDQTHS